METTITEPQKSLEPTVVQQVETLCGSSSESDTVEMPDAPKRKKRRLEAAEAATCLPKNQVDKSPSQQEDRVEKASSVEAAGPPRPLCVICRQPPWRPQVSAVCGHFACDECWARWVCVKFECPV